MLASLFLLAGCMESTSAEFDFPASTFNSGGYGDGDFGATQGGVQDMGLARELIENGRVPPAEAFVVEGMFSEHDLPLQGPPCERLLCLRSALGIAPTLEGEPSAWLQVGMSSTIDPEAFERPALTLIATVDVSGSMGWDYGGDSTPGEVSRRLLRAVAVELGSRDRIAIVTYGSSVSVPLELTSGDRQETIQAVIDGLSENGSTNMEGGLRRAFELARGAEAGTDEVRVMLFTDVRPNVGATSGTEFERLAGEAADDGIGLTVMGMGLGLGQAVLEHMVHLRGGNAFSLFEPGDVDELMADSWPWMVSPIAYDLAVSLVPSDGFAVADAYGFPGDDEQGAGFEVATVFLSRRKGALLVRMVRPGSDDLAGLRVDGRLDYETLEGLEVGQDLVSGYHGQQTDERGTWFEQHGVGKAVALAVLVDGMRRAAEAYGDDREEAIGLMEDVVARFEADVQALADDSLEPELKLARELLDLMRAGAEQGDMYPGY